MLNLNPLYSKSFLSFPLHPSFSSRFYPGGLSALIKPGHIFRILPFLANRRPPSSILPWSFFHHNRIFHRVTLEHHSLTLNSTKPFFVAPNGIVTPTLPPLSESLPPTQGSIVASYLNNQQKTSGLLNVPPEYFTNENTLDAIELKRMVLSVYCKAVYTLSIHNVNNDEKLFEILPELFKSIYPIFQTFNNKSLQTREMAILQHVLVSLFDNKEFSLQFLKEMTSYAVDYSQFEKQKTGSMLNAIEAHVLSRTLLPTKHSITAVNPNYPQLSLTLYNKEKAILVAGQMHTDWFGVKATVDSHGNITLNTIYNDTKMYESGAYRGHLTLKPGLTSNEKYLREYLTKHTTGLKQIIIKHNITQETHPIMAFYKQLRLKEKEIHRNIHAFEKDNNNNFINLPQIAIIKQMLHDFKQHLSKGKSNTEINSIINLGSTEDPGIDTNFIAFFHAHMKISLEKKEYLDEFYLSILLSSKYKKVLYFAQLRQLIEQFPKELKDSANIVLLYIENK